jgi:hypothetical protein
MKLRALVLLLALGWTAALTQPTTGTYHVLRQASGQLTSDQRLWISHAHRQDRDGWIYLHITGHPREMGFQHGYLLAREIDASLRAARKNWEYDSGMEWSWLVEHGAEMFIPRIDSSSMAELDGIVEGLAAAGVQSNRAEMITYNGIIELDGYWWPKMKDSLHLRSADRPKESCSSFIVTGDLTPDGGIVLGHNTMTSYGDADCNIILDILPTTGHRILMQGTPGWIHSGTDFFITDGGLVGSETTIGGFSGFDEHGIPEFVRMRRATQLASSIDEWCAIMRDGNNGGYANAWLIGDVKTNEIARLELGLRYIGFERTKNGYYVGSNVAENLKILRLETNARETDIRTSDVARRVRWKQLMKQYRGKVTVDLAKTFEGDHYDTYLREERLGSRSLCAHWEYDSTDPGEAPFNPSGTVDAKVVDSKMAKRMAFAARWGSGCGTAFNADEFLEEHPQFEWMKEVLRSRASYPWTEFEARGSGSAPSHNPAPGRGE